MEYRAEIDGLRAIAVLSVIFFHAGFEVISGGFLGVDIFFVISGYLITSILIRDLAREKFTFTDFYERRIRRILPALLLVSLVSFPFAILFMLPTQIDAFANSLLSVLLFVSNIFFWSQSGYFSPSVDTMPMIHTWSLAIEEQFYLFYPLLLLVSWKVLKHRTVFLVALIAAFSLILTDYAWRNHPSANFYFLPTRAWELLAGALAAFYVDRFGVVKNQFLGLLGLIAIFISIFYLDDTLPFPSIYGLLPVLGTVLVIVFSHKDSFSSSFLKHPVFVGVGLISYSAYLWHQPILAYARLHFSGSLTPGLALVLCCAVLAISYLSWKYVEQPFRNRKALSRKIVYLSVGSVAMFLAGGAGTVTANSSDIEAYWLKTKSDDYQYMYGMIKSVTETRSDFFLSDEGKASLRECRFNVSDINTSTTHKLVSCYEKYGSGALIIGDSHAIDLYGMVISRFDEPFVIGVTQGDCHPNNTLKQCQYESVFRFVSENPSVFQHIIYEQAGFYLLEQKNGINKNRQIFTSVPLQGRVDGVVSNKERISQVLDYLEGLSKYTSVTWFLPRAEHHVDFGNVLELGCQYPWHYRENQAEMFDMLDADILQLINERKLSLVNGLSQNEVMNFDLEYDLLSCQNIFWSDGNHYSSAGEKRFGKRLPPDFLFPSQFRGSQS